MLDRADKLGDAAAAATARQLAEYCDIASLSKIPEGMSMLPATTPSADSPVANILPVIEE